MDKFYTNFYLRGNYVYVRGYEGGKRFQDKIWYKPSLYISTNKDTEFKTISGEDVDEVRHSSIKEARDFVRKYEHVDGFDIYGSNLYDYACVNENFDKSYDPDLINTICIDIEVSSGDGFPSPDEASQEVTAITASYKDRFVTFGCQDYSTDREDVVYIKCHDEKHLLHRFLQFWQSADPDVITGWNVRFFDIPYLVNRMRKILGVNATNKFSPVGIIKEGSVKIFNREQTEYELCGITTLDYLEVYKKFTYSQQESYRLDHIAHVELGERKLDYSEVENLYQLYETDYQKFIDYNIQDVELVNKLEDKMKLLDMITALAYDAKVNYIDTFRQVRMWDVLIHNYLMENNIVIPPKNDNVKTSQFAGAYVKKPLIGMHDWVVSFDLNSLYPHLIMQYNISPETFLEDSWQNVTVDRIIAGDFSKTENSLTASGYSYKRDKQGFLPEMMQMLYDTRVLAKQKMLEAQTKLEEAKKLNLDTHEIEKEISKYKNLQLAKKVQLNSAYGALGNRYFRFFDVRIAESITLSGQLSIKWIEKKLNGYLNNLLKTDNHDYIIAIDTDSVYVDMGDLINRINPPNPVDFLDKVSKQKLEPFIDKCYEELADMMNAYAQKMYMGREVIADKGIWTAKKRYVLNVHDNEGVRYTTPKLKVMGLETVKSSTPSICREALKKALVMILNEDEQTVQKYIADYKEEFIKHTFEDVAFPRSISDLNKYNVPGNELIIPKGTPIHGRGALAYNYLLKKHNLTRRFELIKDGEKIKFCYMKTPNPIRQNVLSCISTLPSEFDMSKFIDYDLQFEKAFVEPLKAILTAVGWEVEKTNTLMEFFG
jgi:DNA polymerase elongation subunit (family B)